MSETIYCLQCNNPIKSKYAKKFCGSSCAASYNNHKYPKRGLGQYAKPKECINCSKPVAVKYCGSECQHEYAWKKQIPLIESGKGTSRMVKKYLLKKNGNCCNKCNHSEWNGQPIPIELEHIDGNSENNNLENCELLCPNCHAQTPTYKAKNRGNGRHKRRQRYADGLSY